MRPDRRRFLSAVAAGAAISALPVHPAMSTQPRQLIPEWAPHEACLMGWCAAWDFYSAREMAALHTEQARIAHAIARFETVIMFAHPDDVDDARNQLGPDVQIIEATLYDTWTRDTLPTFLDDGSRHLLGVGWNFNVWGEKFPGYGHDRTLASRAAQILEIPFEAAGIVLEGGAIEWDGRGTILTTESCLLNPNRNRGMVKSEVDAALKTATGAHHVIWLPGSEIDRITDGHIDGIARFVDDGIAICDTTDDPEDPEYHILKENIAALRLAKDASGRSIDVIEMPRPDWNVMPERGDDFASTYQNFYVAGDGTAKGLVMPIFDDPAADQTAHDLLQRLHPDHEIVQIRIDQVCEGGGGIHCNTQQIPIL